MCFPASLFLTQTHVLRRIRCNTIYPRVRMTTLPAQDALVWYQHITALNRDKDMGKFNHLLWIEFQGIDNLESWCADVMLCKIPDVSHFRRNFAFGRL